MGNIHLFIIYIYNQSRLVSLESLWLANSTHSKIRYITNSVLSRSSNSFWLVQEGRHKPLKLRRWKSINQS